MPSEKSLFHSDFFFAIPEKNKAKSFKHKSINNCYVDESKQKFPSGQCSGQLIAVSNILSQNEERENENDAVYKASLQLVITTVVNGVVVGELPAIVVVLVIMLSNTIMKNYEIVCAL